MNLDTIAMDKKTAEAAFLEYRTAVREDGGSPEDAMIAAGYKQLAMGRKLIVLTDALKAGGLGNDGFPRLAIARADARECRVVMNRNGAVSFQTISAATVIHRKGRRNIGHSSAKGVFFDYPAGTFTGRVPNKIAPRDDKTWTPSQCAARSMAPNVPPALRPPYLTPYHLLWEAEWHEEAPPAPRDPALLKHIGGDLYAVLAVWDLTPLERAVLAGTRAS